MKKKILVPIMALAIAVTAGVNYKIITGELNKSNTSFSVLVTTAFAHAESGGTSTECKTNVDIDDRTEFCSSSVASYGYYIVEASCTDGDTGTCDEGGRVFFYSFDGDVVESGNGVQSVDCQ